MAYHFKNLIFEGGAARGIAYLGAVKVLEDRGVLKSIERIGGTSAGAINALLLGLNYSYAEMEEILLNDFSFQVFLDDSFGIIRDSYRFIKRFGFYKGDSFHNWISGLIGKKTGNPKSTFEDIQKIKKQNSFKDMYFIGANLSTGFVEIYSHEPEHIDMPIADAVRISMSIPIIFAAKRNTQKDVIVDGGLLNNYPIKLFDRKKYIAKYMKQPSYYDKNNKGIKGSDRNNQFVYNMESLGFRLDTLEEINVFKHIKEPEPKEIKGLISYFKRLITASFNIQANIHLHEDDWHRTIYIDTFDVSSFDFDMDSSKKNDLIKSGIDYTEKYFEKYNNQNLKFLNRPPRYFF